MKYNHIDFAPTPAAREAAKRALASDETTPSPPSVARATVAAVAAGRRLTPPVLRRLASGAEDDAVASWARKVALAMDAADKAASTGHDHSAVVAVVLPLPRDVAEYVSIDGEGADMHVTLCVLGDADTMSPALLAWARMIVDAWSKSTPPLPARLSGVGRFAGVDADAVYLSVDAPGLSAAREKLVASLRAGGIDIASNHGFDPHATLCYVAKGAETPSCTYDLPLSLTFDAAALWAGDDRSQVVSLAGTGDPAMMRDDTVRGEGITLLFDAATPPAVGHRTWNQIARYGTWKGHPQGEFSFTPAVFVQMERNFRAQKNPVPTDYEHLGESIPDSAATDGVPSLAWIVDVHNRGADGFWGLFEWVDARAVEYVRAGKYRYLSPAIRFAAVSRETGERIGARITSVALTNQPFLDGMAPLTASDSTDPRRSLPTAPRDERYEAVRAKVLEVFDQLIPGDVQVSPATRWPSPPPKDTPTMPDITPPVVTPEVAPDTSAADLAAATVRLTEMDGNVAKMTADFNALTERYGKFAASIRKMAGVGDTEDEDAALAKLQGIVDKMNASADAEAAAMADRAIKGHGLTEKVRPSLIAHARRDAVDFAESYPKCIVTAESINASDTTPKPAGAPIAPEVKTLLSTQVTPSNAPPAPIVTMTGTTAERSKAREEMASTFLSTGKARSYAEAVDMADAAITQQFRASAVAPFVS